MERVGEEKGKEDGKTGRVEREEGGQRGMTVPDVWCTLPVWTLNSVACVASGNCFDVF